MLIDTPGITHSVHQGDIIHDAPYTIPRGAPLNVVAATKCSISRVPHLGSSTVASIDINEDLVIMTSR